jgi:ribosomal protein S17
VDPEKLNGREREAALNAQKHADIVGVVVRTGRMDKTVSVRVPKQRWEPRIKKVCLIALRPC